MSACSATPRISLSCQRSGGVDPELVVNGDDDARHRLRDPHGYSTLVGGTDAAAQHYRAALLCDGHLGWVGEALIALERSSDLLADETVVGHENTPGVWWRLPRPVSMSAPAMTGHHANRVIEVRAPRRAQPIPLPA
jgi:hypothetical protein